MASETIFAYVGPKGSGKTHEGTRVVIEQLRRGRFVVAVIPSLDINKVVEYLDDEGVRERLKIVDYEEVDKPDFFPDEARLKMTKDPMTGELVPGPEYDPRGWREAIVPAGAVVVIDEAWRWLESTKSMPERFKKALHMARHWRGPADWSKQVDRDRFLNEDDLWHPALGGAPEKGGDGTKLVSMNILLLTQDYSALNRVLRKQVDQICDIHSYKKSAVPPIIQKLFPAWKTDGRYSVSTFEGHILPERRSKAYQDQPVGKRKSFQILPHLPEIHGLFEYAGGQAEEVAIDDRSAASNDNRLGYIKYVAFLTIVAVGVFGWWAWTGFSAMASTPSKVATVATPSVSTSSKSAAGSSVPVARAAPAPELPTVARVAGTIGGEVIVIDPRGNVRPAPSSDFIQTEAGHFGAIDGQNVSSWSAPIDGRPSGASRTRLGVAGPGAGLGAAAVNAFSPPHAAPIRAGEARR